MLPVLLIRLCMQVELNHYDSLPVSILGLHSSVWIPPLLGAFYAVLGSLHVFADSVALQSPSAVDTMRKLPGGTAIVRWLQVWLACSKQNVELAVSNQESIRPIEISCLPKPDDCEGYGHSQCLSSNLMQWMCHITGPPQCSTNSRHPHREDQLACSRIGDRSARVAA